MANRLGCTRPQQHYHHLVRSRDGQRHDPSHSYTFVRCLFVFFFFLNDRAPPEFSPLSLPDALPIYPFGGKLLGLPLGVDVCYTNHAEADQDDMDNLLTLLAAAGVSFIKIGRASCRE